MVRMYMLDGTMLSDRETMHDQLYMSFSLPEYYGRNLDALWDCLTEKEPGVIVIQRAEQADKDCLLSLLGLLTDLVRENPRWELNLSTGDPDCHAHGAAPEGSCDGDCAHCAEACADKPENAAVPDEEDGRSECGVKALFRKLFD